ncbi:MAG: hypothetical protein KIT00_02105 [Rhodospirillales bacterium]|nr:hypothetical protein [Rhodospirillales bacterium]
MGPSERVRRRTGATVAARVGVLLFMVLVAVPIQLVAVPNETVAASVGGNADESDGAPLGDGGDVRLAQSRVAQPPSIGSWQGSDTQTRAATTAMTGGLLCRSKSGDVTKIFRLFHIMNLNGRDVGPFIPRMPMVGTSGCIHPKGTPPHVDPDLGYVERNCIPKYRRNPPPILVLDIEHWRVDEGVSEAERQISMDKFRRTIGLFRRGLPQTEIGLYRILPRRFHWIDASPRRKEKWRRVNERNRELADMLDVIFPSLYVKKEVEAIDDWLRYAEENIAEAAKYGKPVVPFIWGRYYDRTPSGKKSNPSVPYSDWHAQLEYLLDHPDVSGAIMWDWYANDWDRTRTTEYWRATEDFIREHCGAG